MLFVHNVRLTACAGAANTTNAPTQIAVWTNTGKGRGKDRMPMATACPTNAPSSNPKPAQILHGDATMNAMPQPVNKSTPCNPKTSSLLNFLGEHRTEEHPILWKRMPVASRGVSTKSYVNPTDHNSCIWSFSMPWLRISIGVRPDHLLAQAKRMGSTTRATSSTESARRPPVK